MFLDIKYRDREFLDIIYPILDSENFNKTRDIIHHGVNRYDHSMRVAYYSYKVAKFLRLDYESTARGGLLHDYFFSDDIKVKGKVASIVSHPKYALENANNEFDLNDKEQDIIRTHMFPVTIKPPKYLEGWIVDMTDNVASIYERSYTMGRKFAYFGNVFLLFLINILK